MTTPAEIAAELKKDLGDRILARGDEVVIDVVPTGSMSLDVATVVGGFPRGYVTELYGAEAGGKTTLALHSCIGVAERGGLAIFMDAENKTNPQRVIELGIPAEQVYIIEPNKATDTVKPIMKVIEKFTKANCGMILIIRPYTGHLALDVIKQTLKEQLPVDLIVVDSVHALATGTEIDSDTKDQHMAVLARLMSQFLKSITGILGLTNTALVFINQQRTGFGRRRPYTVTPSGRALTYYAALRVLVTVSKTRSNGIDVIARVKKNSLGRPNLSTEFQIYWATGIDVVADLFEAAIAAKVLDGGSWYEFQGEKLALPDEEGNAVQGKAEALEGLRTKPKVVQAIREAILRPEVDPDTGEIL